MTATPMRGFTLIELSIVLVIIGLIVGGILVGQDLIKSAEVRAQVSQIEKFNSAVNTFRGKFNAIPGDMSMTTTNQFGFVTDVGTCGGGQGSRDGNGLIDGLNAPYIYAESVGETGFFWEDLSSPVAGNLIEGSFPNSGAPAIFCGNRAAPLTSTPGTLYLGDYFPVAKIGHANFIYVYEASGYNWYAVSAVTNTGGGGNAWIVSGTTIPVIQAYNMDKKVDDGLPLSGNVNTVYINGSTQVTATAPSGPTDNTTTCYNTTNNAYSIGSLSSYGANGNCALSFRFQ